MPTDALITQSIPSLINGVSQQPTNQRLTSQAEVQDNVVSDVATGARVRPGTEHIALLAGSAAGGSPVGGVKIHTINRGDDQQFAVVLEQSDINVFALSDGSEVTVNDNAAGTSGAYDYLAYSTADDTAESAFEAVTVADYTFIVNRQKVAAMSGSASTGRTNAHEFLLMVKTPAATASQCKLTMTFGTDTVTGATPGTATSERMLDLLCQALCGVDAPSATTGTGGGSINDWIFTRVSDNVLYGYQFQNANDTVTASDHYGDTMHVLATTGPAGEAPQVRAFSDLTSSGQDGFTLKIKGDDGSNEDEFWVVYSDDEGVWKETVEPGLDDTFDADTMPHALVYDTATGQFSFETISWDDRLVGDTNSAAEPSFIGKTIRDILVHKNRLTLVSDENAIAGESGDFFNLWPTTVTTLVDSDPFDVAGTGNAVAIWDYAVPYRGHLTLFSATGNVIGELLGSRDEPLTIKNARIEDRTNYAISAVKPQAAGDQVYFIADRGGSTAVYGYTEADIDQHRADEFTAHVQSYLPSNIVRMSAGRAENMICFLSSDADEDHRVYIYRFHYLGQEQAMSSWSRWSFADNDVVLSADWIESVLYLLIERQDGIHLEKIDFGQSDQDPAGTATPLGYRVHLDSLVYLTGSYDVVSDITTWTLPYDQATNGGTYCIVRGGAWGTSRGSEIAVLDQSVDGTITARGDFSAQPVYIGRAFTWTYELSEIHLRDSQGRSQRGRTTGRLQLKEARVTYKDTGTFDVQILSREDSDVYSDTFTSQFLNQAVFGPTGLDSGEFDFHIGGDSRNVRVVFTGNSFLPANLTSVEWTGRFVQRSDQA